MIEMRSLPITFSLLWVVGSIGGYQYSQQKDIPPAVAVPVLLALLVELSLYIALAFPDLRERAGRLGYGLPAGMTASAVVPYLICSMAGTFNWQSLALLAVLAAAASWWFVLLPRRAAVDVGFLVLMAGVYLAKPFRDIYPPPVEQLRIDILGQLLWIRLGVAAVLLIRRLEGTGFGFLPEKREWLIGLRNYLYFMPLGVALMYGLEFASFDPAPGWWWKWPATFLGTLWVVALAEELLFRGMLQQWLSRSIGPRSGLVITSLVFGAAHLPFREFPNWEFALMAAVAGWFYGRAFNEGGGIRAAMAAHALTVATWRTLFR